MKTSALANRIIVKVEQPKEKSEGGIIIPERHNERVAEACTTGIIVSIGPRAFIEGFLVEDELKVGDKIAFRPFSGLKLKSDYDTEGKWSLRGLSPSDLVAKIEED